VAAPDVIRGGKINILNEKLHLLWSKKFKLLSKVKTNFIYEIF
jgi:hypothetical protein